MSVPILLSKSKNEWFIIRLTAMASNLPNLSLAVSPHLSCQQRRWKWLICDFAGIINAGVYRWGFFLSLATSNCASYQWLWRLLLSHSWFPAWNHSCMGEIMRKCAGCVSQWDGERYTSTGTALPFDTAFWFGFQKLKISLLCLCHKLVQGQS